MDSTLFSTLLVLFVVSLARQQVNPLNRQINPPNCGQPATANERAAGGRNAADGEFPWLAGLEAVLFDERRGWCTAFIINSNWLLSAGHCCVNDTREYRELIAHVGNVTWDSTRRRFNSLGSHRVVSRVSLYNSSLSRVEHMPNDICLLETAESLDTNNPMMIPICLPNPGDRLSTSDNYVFAGFGVIDFQGRTAAKVQVLYNNSIVADDKCFEMAEEIRRSHNNPAYDEADDELVLKSVGENNFCRKSTPYQSPCFGDSGGPLMHLSNEKWTAVGVLCEGIATNPRIPGEYPCGIVYIFVDVLSHYNWIYEKITGHSPPTDDFFYWYVVGFLFAFLLVALALLSCVWVLWVVCLKRKKEKTRKRKRRSSDSENGPTRLGKSTSSGIFTVSSTSKEETDETTGSLEPLEKRVSRPQRRTPKIGQGAAKKKPVKSEALPKSTESTHYLLEKLTFSSENE